MTKQIKNGIKQSRSHTTNKAAELTPFDEYEVHGVAKFGKGRNRHCEQVPDAEAQFWSLYGHIPGEGLECIGDFRSRRFAEEIKARITGGHAPALVTRLRQSLRECARILADYDTSDGEEGVAYRTAAAVLAANSLPPRRVPGDPEKMNDLRSAWAATAVHAFIEATGTDEEDALCDLLADLMHFCDRHGYDLEHELNCAWGHYEAETVGERP